MTTAQVDIYVLFTRYHGTDMLKDVQSTLGGGLIWQTKCNRPALNFAQETLKAHSQTSLSRDCYR